MTIKYVRFSVAINGIDADKEHLEYLVGWIQQATKAGLLGNCKELFKFRDEFEGDIEVVIEETAGE